MLQSYLRLFPCFALRTLYCAQHCDIQNGCGFFLPLARKKTNKGCFCRTTAFVGNNNGADRLTASWCSIKKKQENEKRSVRDPEVCRGFSPRGRRVVELNVLADALDG